MSLCTSRKESIMPKTSRRRKRISKANHGARPGCGSGKKRLRGAGKKGSQ